MMIFRENSQVFKLSHKLIGKPFGYADDSRSRVIVDYSEFQSSVVKRKPKELLWPIKKDGDNPVNQSKLEVITRSLHKARKKGKEKVKKENMAMQAPPRIQISHGNFFLCLSFPHS